MADDEKYVKTHERDNERINTKQLRQMKEGKKWKNKEKCCNVGRKW